MLALSLAAALAAATPGWAGLDAETEKEIPRFVSMDVGDMTPSYIQHMLTVETKDVPKKYQKKFDAKKLELYTMQHIGEGKRKGTIRMPETNCSAPKEAQSQDIQSLGMAGFVEVFDREVEYLSSNTKCTQRQMMCEFSLQIVYEKKGKKTITRYFLHVKDPLMALVSEFRERGGSHNTNFFGSSVFPQCS